MATPRSGSTGIGSTKGDIYVVDANGNLERLPVGTDGFGLIADSAAALGLAYKSVAPRAMIFMGGASMGAGDTGKHFAAQDTSNGGKTATLSSDNQMASGITGFISLLTWFGATADATTVFKINKNGLVVATLTLTGTSGGIVVPTLAVTIGDLIAVEYDAGQSPGRTTTQVWANR